MIADVVHGDIKPGNVVVFSKSSDSHDVVAKMIDFGYSCYGMEDEDMVQIIGTPLWSAPENIGDGVTILSAKKMDVYSFALVCCWILFFDTVSLDNRIEVPMEESSIADKPKKKMYRFIERIKDAERPEGPISEVISQTLFLGEQKSLLLQKLLTEALCKNPSSRPYHWSEFILVLSKLQGLE
jgi:serine/threonine protein kinase